MFGCSHAASSFLLEELTEEEYRKAVTRDSRRHSNCTAKDPPPTSTQKDGIDVVELSSAAADHAEHGIESSVLPPRASTITAEDTQLLHRSLSLQRPTLATQRPKNQSSQSHRLSFHQLIAPIRQQLMGTHKSNHTETQASKYSENSGLSTPIPVSLDPSNVSNTKPLAAAVEALRSDVTIAENDSLCQASDAAAAAAAAASTFSMLPPIGKNESTRAKRFSIEPVNEFHPSEQETRFSFNKKSNKPMQSEHSSKLISFSSPSSWLPSSFLPYISSSTSSRRCTLQTAVDKDWEEFYDSSAGAKYWFNKVTGEATWIAPRTGAKFSKT